MQIAQQIEANAAADATVIATPLAWATGGGGAAIIAGVDRIG